METTPIANTLNTPLSTQVTSVQLRLVSATLIASVITIIVNPLTLLALFKQKMITKNSINLFIASLCCSDLLLGVSTFLFQLQKILILRSVEVGRFIFLLNCVGASLMVTGFFVSNINVSLISFDRAYATIAPFEYKSRASTKTALIALAFTWAITVLQAVIPIAISLGLGTQTNLVEYAYEVVPYKFRLYWVTPLMYIGTAVNVVLYFIIVISFFKITSEVQPSTSSSDVRSRRMTRTVTMVIGSLLIGSIPLVTIAAVTHMPDAPYLWSYAMYYDIATLCTTIPTFFNNFLYVWQLPDFKRAFRRLLPLAKNSTEASDSNATT
ncbi:hypothetical protein CAPTEDRAFT_189696 [Capitella teleta]|uniref:G-protein coupled receptors family 1 profile domain-containing protein n=1 Tax=Capitella teleta TaxID=283909 RepID=R7TAB6_CAPTE|nr:hypothetical protein CAPTEDRAFT_189696 [Capitella teleta]|eukprot:ELT90678.1 hypothetical protein CAPTEDRAFT_189696 [Capitella teleta]